MQDIKEPQEIHTIRTTPYEHEDHTYMKVIILLITYSKEFAFQ